MSNQCLLAGQSQPSCRSAGSNDQSLGENLFLTNLQRERAFAQVSTDYMTQLIAGAETARLRAHVFDQRWTLNAFGESGKIFYQRSERELATRLVTFQHQRF